MSKKIKITEEKLKSLVGNLKHSKDIPQNLFFDELANVGELIIRTDSGNFPFIFFMHHLIR